MTLILAFLAAPSSSADSSGMSLAVTMLVIFGSAKFLAEVFERLKQPGIVGEILAGILVGPGLLGWIQPSEFTITMAELGVMFLLFQVGLEVEPDELMKVGGTAVAVGVLGVVVPMASGYVLFRLLGHGNLESVFVGTALTATSMGITAKVLAAKGLLHRTAAKIILGAAVIDDVLALLLLGGVSSFAEGRANLLRLGLTSLGGLLFVLLIAKWGTRTVGAVMPRIRLHLGESQFAMAMILLFGLAALSQLIGVAAIIGAFLAGMALAKALPDRVHDLSHGVTELLVPFFLANIGLHFDVATFSTRSTVLVALALVPVAVVSKMAGCGFGAWRFGRTIATRVGVGMVPRGEFCMVVAQVGLSLQAISNATYATIVFMAVVAALVTPPLLKVAFRGVLGQTAEDDESFRIG